MRAALFITCLGDTMFPEAGRSTVQVLERLGHEVVFPEQQTCCGQMHANSGYRDEALALARRFVRVFGDYEAIVSPCGVRKLGFACKLMGSPTVAEFMHPTRPLNPV